MASNFFDDNQQSSSGNFFDDPNEQGQGFINAGNLTSQFGNWLKPKEDPSLSGAVTTAGDLLRTGANTFGVGDQVAAIQDQARRAGVSGPGSGYLTSVMAPALIASGLVSPSDLKAEQAKTDEAKARLGGGLSVAAETAGYVPFGQAGIAKGTADALGVAAPIFRRVVGNTVEGAVGGGVAAAGHDQSVPTGMLAGGLTSAALSPVVAVANWAGRNVATPTGRLTGALSSPEDVVPATTAAKNAAYQNASTHEFNSADPINAYNGAKATLTGPQQQGLSPGMNQAFAGHVKAMGSSPTVNAEDIDGYGRRLYQAATTPDDKFLAQKVKNNLDGPVLGATPPTSGQPVGSALMQIEQARQAAQQATMATGIQAAKEDLAKRFWSPAPWAEQQLPYYKNNPTVSEGLNQIIRSSGSSGQSVNPQTVGHIGSMGAEAVGGAIGGPAGALTGEALSQFGHPLIKGLAKTMNRADLQNQLSNLTGPATGMPTTWTPNFRGLTVGEAVRQATLANQASQGY